MSEVGGEHQGRKGRYYFRFEIRFEIRHANPSLLGQDAALEEISKIISFSKAITQAFPLLELLIEDPGAPTVAQR